jgi:hypothetical protein
MYRYLGENPISDLFENTVLVMHQNLGLDPFDNFPDRTSSLWLPCKANPQVQP